MRECARNQKNMIAYRAGELPADETGRIRAHLARCSRCREELALTERVLREADAARADVADAVESVNWEAAAKRIADSVFEKTAKAEAGPQITAKTAFRPIWAWLWPDRASWKGVYAGLLVGLLLGAAATLLIIKPPKVRPPASQGFYASGEFLDRVELAMARRETLDYLEKSQYLLLDFSQSSPEGRKAGASAFASERTKDLLAKKKYLNTQLDRYQMSKAKAICDQIEMLFLELSQISAELSAAEADRIQNMIEERQILLKINLVKKELKESEI